MVNLLLKSYNCYISYLDNLNFGRTDQNYNLLYDSVILLKSNINNPKFIEYFINNLSCNE